MLDGKASKSIGLIQYIEQYSLEIYLVFRIVHVQVAGSLGLEMPKG